MYGPLVLALALAYERMSPFVLPLFLVGMYFSWLIMLFGAQVTYAFQNRESYLQQKLAENVNQRGREFVALRLMTCIGQRFQMLVEIRIGGHVAA